MLFTHTSLIEAHCLSMGTLVLNIIMQVHPWDDWGNVESSFIHNLVHFMCWDCFLQAHIETRYMSKQLNCLFLNIFFYQAFIFLLCFCMFGTKLTGFFSPKDKRDLHQSEVEGWTDRLSRVWCSSASLQSSNLPSGMCKSRLCICSTLQPWQIYTARACVSRPPEAKKM